MTPWWLFRKIEVHLGYTTSYIEIDDMSENWSFGVCECNKKLDYFFSVDGLIASKKQQQHVSDTDIDKHENLLSVC